MPITELHAPYLNVRLSQHTTIAVATLFFTSETNQLTVAYESSSLKALGSQKLLGLLAHVGQQNVSDTIIYLTRVVPAFELVIQKQLANESSTPSALITHCQEVLESFYKELFADLIFNLVGRNVAKIDRSLKSDLAAIKEAIINTIVDSDRTPTEKQAALTAIQTEGSTLHAVFMCKRSLTSPKMGKGLFLKAEQELNKFNGTIAPPNSLVASAVSTASNSRAVSPSSSNDHDSGTELSNLRNLDVRATGKFNSFAESN